MITATWHLTKALCSGKAREWKKAFSAKRAFVRTLNKDTLKLLDVSVRTDKKDGPHIAVISQMGTTLFGPNFSGNYRNVPVRTYYEM